jgi:small subunit ribosomal protein S20
MANIKSAEKRARQTIKRTARNKSIKTRVKSSRKAVTAAILTGDAKVVTAKLEGFASTADKAANAGVIHRNAANRLKSRAAKAAAKGAPKAAGPKTGKVKAKAKAKSK